MCDDLIAQHYYYLSSNGSTKTPSKFPDAHIFVNNAPINHLWFFLPPSFLPDHLSDLTRHHLPAETSGTDPITWSVNVYNKEAALKIYKDWKATAFDLLYEMRRSPLAPTSTAACPLGFLIKTDPSYLTRRDPIHISDAVVDSETVLTVIEESTGLVAGCMMYQVDDETGRVYFSSVEVYENYRRKGLAKAMLLKAMENERDNVTLWLTVFAENVGAVTMYFGLGFLVQRCLWVVGGKGPGGP